MVMGIIAMFIGAIWFGQGMGFFPYPASSFMVNQGQWAHFGGEMALTGLVLIVLSQRGTKKAAVDEEDTPPPAKGGEHKT
jgi:hypothetical protein